MEELIKLQEIYIQLLIAELEEVVPIAYNHGWRTSRFEEGELMRQKMKEAKEAAITLEDAAKIFDVPENMINNAHPYGGQFIEDEARLFLSRAVFNTVDALMLDKKNEL